MSPPELTLHTMNFNKSDRLLMKFTILFSVIMKCSVSVTLHKNKTKILPEQLSYIKRQLLSSAFSDL